LGSLPPWSEAGGAVVPGDGELERGKLLLPADLDSAPGREWL